MKRRRQRSPLLLLLPVGMAVVLLLAAATYGELADDSSLSERVRFEQQGTLFGADEFAGPAGSPPSAKNWSTETGGGGWGNDEEQAYTSDPANVRLDGDGRLVLEALSTDAGITSARLNTYGKIDFTYGLVEARIKMPKGKGVHPAFWLLGSSIADVGYPDCGEIDITELVNGGRPAHTALHGPWMNAGRHRQPKWKVSQPVDIGVDLSEDFHTYWIARIDDTVTIGIDDAALVKYAPDDLPTDAHWVMEEPFFVVLNVAVGGDWPGSVDPAALPATMLVDWVRVYG